MSVIQCVGLGCQPHREGDEALRTALGRLDGWAAARKEARSGPRAGERAAILVGKEQADWANRPRMREGEFPFSFSFLIFQTNFEMQIQIDLKFDFNPHNTKIICSNMNA